VIWSVMASSGSEEKKVMMRDPGRAWAAAAAG